MHPRARYLFLGLVMIVTAYTQWHELPTTASLFGETSTSIDISSRSKSKDYATDKIQTPETPVKTVHVLYGLSGNATGFFQEFQVSLKSVLLNCPHKANMEIHIMADERAYNMLYDTTFNETGIDDIPWYRNITIIPHNVQPFLRQWKKDIRQNTGQARVADAVHTIGTFFRLFAHEILKDFPDNNFIFYLDTDVTIMANLNEIFEIAANATAIETAKMPSSAETRIPAWYDSGPGTTEISRQEQPVNHFYSPTTNISSFTPTVIMTEECAGVMLVNPSKLNRLWKDFVPQVGYKDAKYAPNDQDIVMDVREKFPGVIEYLPLRWSLTVTVDWRGNTAEAAFKKRPELGLVHYNGGGKLQTSAYEGHTFLTQPERAKSWGIPGNYYNHLPWSWVHFMGKSHGVPNPWTKIRVSERQQSTTKRENLAERRVTTNSTKNVVLTESKNRSKLTRQ